MINHKTGILHSAVRFRTVVWFADCSMRCDPLLPVAALMVVFKLASNPARFAADADFQYSKATREVKNRKQQNESQIYIASQPL